MSQWGLAPFPDGLGVSFNHFVFNWDYQALGRLRNKIFFTRALKSL